MRRFFKVLAIAIPAVALLGAVALVVYLQSSGFHEFVRSRIVQELEKRFEVRAELDGARLDLAGTAVHLEGLRLYDSRFPAPEPALDLPRVSVDFSLISFIRPRATLDDLRLEGMVVRVLEDPNGTINLVNMFRKPDGPPPSLEKLIDLGIRRWRLESGLLIFRNQPIRLASSEGGMDLQVSFFPDRERYAGILKLTGVDFGAGPVTLAPMDLDIKFELLENSIEFPSIEASTPALKLEQTGAIVDLADFTYRFDGSVEAHPARFAAPDLSSEIRSGTFLARGAFTGQGGDFRYRGRLDSEAFQWREFGFRDFSASIRLDRQSLVSDEFSFRFEGGLVEGSGELAFDAAAPSTFRIRGGGFQLSRLAPWLQSPELMVRGRASTVAEVSWPGLEFSQIGGRGTTEFQGNLILPQNPLTPAAFPFQGNARYQLGGSGVRFGEGHLDTLNSTVEFAGEADFDGGYRIEVQLQAQQGHNLIDFASLSPVWPDFAEGRPLPEAGSVRSELSLEGRGGRFVIAGGAQLSQLRVADQELGELETDFRFTPDELLLSNLRLDGDPHRLTGDLDLELAEDGNRLRRLEIEAVELAVSDWLGLIDVDSPLEGRVSGDVAVLEKAPGDYQGNGNFRIEGARLLEQPVERLAGEYRIDGRELTLSSLEGRALGGQVTGRLLYQFTENRFDAELQGEGLELGELIFLPSDLEVSGNARLEITAAGNFENYRLHAGLQTPRLKLGSYSLDNVSLEAARPQPDEARLELQVNAGFLGNAFQAEGELDLESPHPFEGDLQFTDLPLAPYLDLLSPETRVDLQGEVTGRVRVAGQLDDLTRIRADADLSEVRLVAESYEVRNRTPLRVRYADRVVRLQEVRFSGRDTELQLSGNLDLRREPAITLKADGTLNLLLVNPFLEGGSTLGTLELEIVVSGPLANPRLAGDARLERAFLQHPSLPTPLFETTGRLRFTADQISIDELSTRTAFGTLNAQGGIFLERFQPVRWLVNVYGSGLRIEYPERVFSTLDLDVDFLRNDNSRLLSGVVYIRSAEYTERISLPELLLRYTGTAGFTPSAAGEEVALDIEVEGYRTLQIDNNLADVTASGDFKIRGTIDNPVILGSLTIDEGRLFLENNEYEITRGSINFNNPRQTRPVFNFEAETEVRDISVNILVTGPIDQLKVSFRSDPPLPTSSVVSLLAVGQTGEELFGAEGGQEQVGSLAVFGAGALLSKSLGRKLQEQSSRLFGFDRVSIDPFLFGSERNPGARVTLGKQLGSRVSVTYSTDLGNQTQGQIVVVEVKITDWLTAVGTGEQDGALALDFKLKKRF